MRSYGTCFGSCPAYEKADSYVKWFYELWEKVPAEESAVYAHVLQDTDSLMEQGFLSREDTLKLDIPVLARAEYQEECSLASEYAEKAAGHVREVLLPVFESGYVSLPSHLKSVPKWQQYMFCGDSVPMMVICKAREKGLFLSGVDYPVPASLLVYEKE